MRQLKLVQHFSIQYVYLAECYKQNICFKMSVWACVCLFNHFVLVLNWNIVGHATVSLCVTARIGALHESSCRARLSEVVCVLLCSLSDVAAVFLSVCVIMRPQGAEKSDTLTRREGGTLRGRGYVCDTLLSPGSKTRCILKECVCARLLSFLNIAQLSNQLHF